MRVFDIVIRNSYTKTNVGKRMISLDKDTIDVLKKA